MGSYKRLGHTSTEGSSCEDREKRAFCMPQRETSEETKPINTLILDFYPPKLWGFKLPSLWYFVMAARGNYYR